MLRLNGWHVLAFIFLIHCPFANAASTEVGIAESFTHFSYKEELDAPLKSTETSDFWLTELQAHVAFPSGYFLTLSYGLTPYISSSYDGTTQSGVPVTNTNTLSFTKTEALLYMPISAKWQFYFGYGYNKWVRILESGFAYKEIYTWNYYAMGLRTLLSGNTDYNLSLDLSTRPIFGGKIQVITSEYHSGGADSEMNLGSRTGLRVSLPIQFGISSGIFMGVAPWIERSGFSESDVVTNSTLEPNPSRGIQEPSSTTEQYGVEASISFRL